MTTATHAKTIHGLVGRLSGYPDQALEGFAKSTQLDLADLRRELAVTVGRALDDERVTLHDLVDYVRGLRRADKALDALAGFKRKEAPAREFCDRVGLRRTGQVGDLHRRIRNALYRQQVPLQRLADFLDEEQEEGRQHIFLFQLDAEHIDYLDQLRDPEYLRDRMHQLGLDDCVDAPRYVWDARSAQLAEVRYRDAGLLQFKWVETRWWLQPLPDAADEVAPVRQRSVTFFRLDLATGAAELRIQKVERDPKRTLQNELRTYRRLLSELIDFDRFAPLMLEPSVSHFLTSKAFEVKRWRVELANGQEVGGKGGGPKLLASLANAFRSFFALYVTGFWTRHRGTRPIRLRMDGRTDELRVFWETEREELDELLTQVRQLAPVGHHGDDAPRPPGWILNRTALEKVHQTLDRVGRREVTLAALEKVADDVAIKPAKLRRAIEAGSADFPDLVPAFYRVRCPTTKRSVLRRRSVVEFDSFSKVPAKVGCDHGSRRKKHRTAGNVLLYFPNYEPPPVQWGRIWPLLLLVGVILLTTVALAGVLSLDLSLPGNALVGLSFLLIVIAEYVLAQWIVGYARIQQSVTELGKLYKQVLGEESLLWRAYNWVRCKFSKADQPGC